LTGQTGSNCGGNYTTGPNNDWGNGTIDALAAVQACVGGPPPPTPTPEPTVPPTPTPEPTVPPPTSTPAPADTMHVQAIDMWYKKAGPNYFVYTQVTIVNQNNNPVSGATVYLITTLPNSSTDAQSNITGSDGTVTFRIKSNQTGLYTSEVTNVTHPSNNYDPDSNLETSEQLAVP